MILIRKNSFLPLLSGVRIISFFIIFFTLNQALHAQWSQVTPHAALGPFCSLGPIIFSGGSGVLRSNDFGASWTNVSNGIPDDGIESIASLGNVLCVGLSNNGIYRSTDSGRSWNPAYFPHYAGVPAFYSMISFHNKLFAGTNSGGMYYSVDSGRNWAYILANPPFHDEDIGAYSFVTKDTFIFAGSPLGNVYRSSDDGSTWDKFDPDPHFRDLALGLGIADTTLFAGTTTGLYRSENFGKSWSTLDTNLFRRGITCIATFGDTVVTWSNATSTFLISSDLGDSWTNYSQGWPGTDAALSLYAFGNFLFGGSTDYGGWRRSLSSFGYVEDKDNSVVGIHSFPNPFTHSTTIFLSPISTGYASISIVNLLGTQVGSLFSGELDASSHTFTWNPSPSVPNGVYECIVRSEEGLCKIPVVLIR